MRPNRQQEHDNQPDSELDDHAGVQECPECDSQPLIRSRDGSELSCEACGLIIEDEAIDRGPEWRAFTEQERHDKSRVGAPTTSTMHDKGLTTQIDWQNTDAHGRSLSSGKRKQMNRLRKWQGRIRTRDAGERNLQFALGEINRMASALGVPGSVREVASVIYRRALAADLIRGRSIEGVATGCLYAGCRKEGIPRSLEEMTEVSRVDRLEIGRAYRYVAQELGLEMIPVDPRKYVPRFCSELDVSEDVRIKTNEILQAAMENGLVSGKSPTGYAAAAIYAATLLCGERKTQKEVADVAQVTEVTIRNRYQEQLEAFDSQ